jgi:hypothetical protein
MLDFVLKLWIGTETKLRHDLVEFVKVAIYFIPYRVRVLDATARRQIGSIRAEIEQAHRAHVRECPTASFQQCRRNGCQ